MPSPATITARRPMTAADNWSSGVAYERYIGRWSRPVAVAFIDWLAVPAGRRWLDLGCGTGALSAAILHGAAPASVVGIDPSPDFVAEATAQVDDPRARFAVGAAGDLPLGDRSADVAVSGLVLNFVPDLGGALVDLRRVVAPGGAVAAYVWDYAGRMELIRRFWDAAVDLDPAAAAEDEGTRFPLCAADALAAAFEAAGLTDVRTTAIDVPTVFADFDDLWAPFLAAVGPAPAYVNRLERHARDRLRDRLRESLPIALDGSISLVARAWAVRGRSA